MVEGVTLVCILLFYQLLVGIAHISGSLSESNLTLADRYALRHPWEICLKASLEEEIQFRAGPICIGLVLFWPESDAMWLVVGAQAAWFAHAHTHVSHMSKILHIFPDGLVWGAIVLLAIRYTDSPAIGLVAGTAIVVAMHGMWNLHTYLCAASVARRLIPARSFRAGFLFYPDQQKTRSR
jgi:hypothetical protein